MSGHSAHVDTFTRDNLPPPDQWPDLLFTLPALSYPDILNCGTELLREATQVGHGDRACLKTLDDMWTYADLLRTANQIAHVLVDDCAIVPGNRILLRGPNNPWLVAAWLAIMKVGAVAVATMPLLREAELRVIVDTAKVSVAICDARYLDHLVEAARPGTFVLSMGGSSPDDLTARAAAKPSTFVDVPTAADDVCLIAFTSGTTGRPKGCMHFHRDVMAVTDTFSQYVLQPLASDTFIASPPMAFTYGLGGMVIFPLHAGASTVLLERASPAMLAEAIERHRATVVFTAPTAYRAMLRLPESDFSSLRRCVSAGETLSKATSDAWHERTGLRIIDGLGATEMLHIFISAADADIRPGATGKAVPGFEAQIVDDDDQPVPDGVLGRLAVRGPVGCRYLADQRQTTYVRDGWNYTGDTYLRDVDGYYWFQARADDMIISSGYNIAGPEVEDALLKHAAVERVGVVGVPDEDRGSIVKAFVVLSEGFNPSEELVTELQDFVKTQIAPYKYPRAIEFRESLPETATGKLQRFRLREE